MAKKCIPISSGYNSSYSFGNITLFMIMIILTFILYYLYVITTTTTTTNKPTTNNIPSFFSLHQNLGNNNNNNDPLTNPYIPPLRNTDQIRYDLRPIATQSTNLEYKQIGILTRGDKEILPLMGRRKTSRYKWQYYTIIGGGNGNLQTKLPVSVNGKSCTGEYGCDEIYNNDTVYVEGYKDIFVATIYENNSFEYVL